MHDCGIFDKALDQWKELTTNQQICDEFQTHFQNDEEKFNSKKKIHDKMGGIGSANA